MASFKLVMRKYLTMIGIALFFVLSTISMFFYTGGTKQDPNTIGYSFILNKFSDLGMKHSYSGNLNIVSSSLFNLGLIIVGITLSMYIFNSLKYFYGKKMNKALLIISGIMGILSCIGFAGMGIFPRDINIDMHHLLQYVAFLSFFVMASLFTYLIFKDEKYPKKYAIVFLVCVFFQFVYLFIVFDVFYISLIVDCIAQKLIVYIQLITFFIQSIGFLQIQK